MSRVGARATMARTAAMGTGTMLTGSNSSSIMMDTIRNGARTTMICGDLVTSVLRKNVPYTAPTCTKRRGCSLLSDGKGVLGKQILPYKNNICMSMEFVGCA